MSKQIGIRLCRSDELRPGQYLAVRLDEDDRFTVIGFTITAVDQTACEVTAECVAIDGVKQTGRRPRVLTFAELGCYDIVPKTADARIMTYSGSRRAGLLELLEKPDAVVKFLRSASMRVPSMVDS